MNNWITSEILSYKINVHVKYRLGEKFVNQLNKSLNKVQYHS